MHTSRSINTSCKTMLIVVFSFSLEMTSVNSAIAQNPWLSESRPLIEEAGQLETKRNTWQDKNQSKTANEIDESKYPPFEEDKT